MNLIILVAALIVAWLVFTALFKLLKTVISTAIAVLIIVVILMVFGVTPADLVKELFNLPQTISDIVTQFRKVTGL
jgi:multisubunit Na+/H+ antiporter MnhE subunit